MRYIVSLLMSEEHDFQNFFTGGWSFEHSDHMHLKGLK